MDQVLRMRVPFLFDSVLTGAPLLRVVAQCEFVDCFFSSKS